MHIRTFTADDIPEVGRLHQKGFAAYDGVAERTPEIYAAYLRHVMLEGPHAADVPRSLVAEQGDQIVGFLGIIPVHMQLQGRPIVAACCTQFVVDPDRRGLTALLLLRTLFNGQHDLVFSDMCGAKMVRIWEWAGASCFPLSSLGYLRPLRPAALAVTMLRERRRYASVARVASPFTPIVDAFCAKLPGRPFGNAIPTTTGQRLDAAAMRKAFRTIVNRRSLLPDYEEEAALRWRLARISAFSRAGPLRSTMVISENGDPVGWYVAHFPRHGISEVLQVVANRSSVGAVLDHLAYDAWNEGAVAISGRVDPAHLREYSDARCMIGASGPALVAYSHDPGVLDALHRGDALLSRLEGEWCARIE